LARVYGQKDLEFSGPLYESITAEGDKVRLHFTHAAGLKTRDGQPVQSLAIAGEDHKFVWAVSKIEGQTLMVWSPKVPKPVAVRYAWGECPPVNLVNGEDLPASGFRTDDWPVSTSRKN
jgi:sialate O-acetylesterase